MSLKLRRIELAGFRKFRDTMVIEGLSDGLNIVIEPNETGKSTLLEALRAAFFVRHGTRNQLAQSYAPHGEAIGPEVKVAFDVQGVPWSVAKRFLKGPTIEVSGPQGRAQGDEAEARLHELLGSIRDSSQRGDTASQGALGLLWVAQMEALEVSAPGQIVRDTVRSTLEAEVGSIMGGPAYKRVRDRVEEQFGRYWSPGGQKRGRQKEASDRLEAAEAAARHASERHAQLERTFADLEAARARLKVVQREIADTTDAHERKQLTESLEVARAAAQILATRQAESEAIGAKVRGLEDLDERHRAAQRKLVEAETAVKEAREQREHHAPAVDAAKQRLSDARDVFVDAQAAHREARAKLKAAEELAQTVRRRSATAAARKRHAELVALEDQIETTTTLAATLLPATVLTGLEKKERSVAEAQAILNAGATRIRVEGDVAGVSIDGLPATTGERTIVHETLVVIGSAELTVLPPPGTASAQDALAIAVAALETALREAGVASLAEARAGNDAARDAGGALRTLEAKIEATTPADDTVGLAAGPDALKVYVAQIPESDDTDAAELPDLAALVQAIDAAETTQARAQGAQDSAIEALRTAEQEDAPLASAEAGAASDLANAQAELETIEKRADFAGLTPDLTLARENAAAAAVRLEAAKRDAIAHDAGTIGRKIEVIDARTRAAGETRTKLETDVARLEGTVQSEGGMGWADRDAAAQDELVSAGAALERITEEANVLKLLRTTLVEARNETSAKFVGPVAKRAKRHIERLLPGCDLSFSEDLGLEAVIRGGVSEGCADLSRGTQEQLAVLTRIAFADMLLEQGRPVSLILDDPLVYSDDARLDLMVEILTEAAERMQVILLTCRDRAFRHVPGNRVSLASAAG